MNPMLYQINAILKQGRETCLSFDLLEIKEGEHGGVSQETDFDGFREEWVEQHCGIGEDDFCGKLWLEIEPSVFACFEFSC